MLSGAAKVQLLILTVSNFAIHIGHKQLTHFIMIYDETGYLEHAKILVLLLDKVKVESNKSTGSSIENALMQSK